MDESTLTYIVTPVLTFVIGAATWYGKRYFAKKDEEQKRIFEERDRDKQAIKDTIEELKTEVKQTSKELKTFQALIVGCEHDDCPNRKLLKEYLLNKED